MLGSPLLAVASSVCQDWLSALSATNIHEPVPIPEKIKNTIHFGSSLMFFDLLGPLRKPCRFPRGMRRIQVACLFVENAFAVGPLA